MDAIVALRDQQLRIIERLDNLSLGIRGQTSGKDKDCPLVASPAATDLMASSTDAPQTSFDAPWQTLVYLSPTVRWEQDPSSSESVSQDLPPGVPLCTMPPTSALRQCIQTLGRLDAKLDFMADVHLPSSVASSQLLRLPDGRWELGTSIQIVIVKSSAQIVTRLQEQATYTSFKSWLLAVEDWVLSHTYTTPDNLGQATVCAVACLTMSSDIYLWLETNGTLGTMQVDGVGRRNHGDTTWW